MKRLVLLAIFGLISSNAYSLTLNERIGNVKSQFSNGIQFTAFETIVPIMGRQLTGDNSFRAGVLTHALTYGIFSADTGYATSDVSDAGNKTGSALLGGSILVDRALGSFFPELKPFLGGVIPTKSQGFTFAIRLGVGAIYDSTLKSGEIIAFAGPSLGF